MTVKTPQSHSQTGSNSLSFALKAHHAVANNPHDWTKHPQVQRSFAHAVVLRAIARRIAPRVVSLIDDAIASWPLPLSEQAAFRAMSEQPPWSLTNPEEIEAMIAAQLGQHPFGDVGAARSVVWGPIYVLDPI